MKTILIAAAAFLTVSALPALAESEGGGDSFGLQTPGITTVIGAEPADTGSAAYPDVAGRPGSHLAVSNGGLVSESGSEAPKQSANSLPVGYDADTMIRTATR